MGRWSRYPPNENVLVNLQRNYYFKGFTVQQKLTSVSSIVCVYICVGVRVEIVFVPREMTDKSR